MSQGKAGTERWAAARVAANAAAHGVSGSAEYDAWRLPPLAAVLVAVVLIVCAEAGGASMVRFKVELTRWARGVMLAHPEVHGLVGVRDVDERILDEALVKFDAGLRLFHLHAEGMGLVILATTAVAATLARGRRVRGVMIALL